MELQDVVDYLKVNLFAGLLECELDDATLEQLIDVSLKEVSLYYNGTELLQVPGQSCIDLAKYPRVNNVMNVYRSTGITSGGTDTGGSINDPLLMSQLQMFNYGSTAYSSSWIYNYGAYSSAQRTANTISTDLMFRQDKAGQKLYVNFSAGAPSSITIEYTPKLHDVSEIPSEYWQDVLKRLSLAHTKIALGRARTRFVQSGALYTTDGQQILQEGTTELNELRERLRKANDYFLPMD